MKCDSNQFDPFACVLRAVRVSVLVLAASGCSVLSEYRQPEAVLDTPLAQNEGWHLASPAERAAVSAQQAATGSPDVSSARTVSGAGASAAQAAVETGEEVGAAVTTTRESTGRAAAMASKATTDTVIDTTSAQSVASVPVVGLLSGSVFNDPALAELLTQLSASNLQIQQAAARLRQAEAVLSGAGASRRPQLGASLGVQRDNRSGSALNSASGSDGGSVTQNGSSRGVGNSYSAGANISWTPDVWGRVAAQVASSEASLAVAQADRRAIELQVQVNLIQAYWRMRLAEQRLQLLTRSIASSERSLQLTRNQYASGLVARADVLQAETQLQSVITQRHALERSRATERHAIAVLLGKPPVALRIAPGQGALADVPALPDTLSIDLLRRRPDVRSAERKVAMANASVGIAHGAWLPDLSFSSALGLGAGTFADLISSPLRTWSLGTQLAATLFDGGARRAALAQQEALYDETVAAYRQQVLTALQEIEDALLANRTLAKQTVDQQELVRLAEAAERVVRNRYQSGLVNYLELATAERLTLGSRDELLSLQAERLNAYVSLMAALGGGWDEGSGVEP
ncbi:MAG: efflux transporter outer membrane subunit [Lautropia sp.]|nr:efflux transporter outer membrane subunit [Lautropia sp.]